MNKSINKHLKDEMNFFMAHDYYKPLASRCGIYYLSKKLNQVLINHIQTTLPDLKARVAQHLDKYSRELILYG